ncbi:TraR/DksA family transcriptional regulator [Streptomyces sp. NPDC017179]|uniref:TraR/DksA family transcriptional regulator n=1 Tax=Streptomyces sp. NPDC017179 TaxID=3364979 RepID=UPI0037B2321F
MSDSFRDALFSPLQRESFRKLLAAEHAGTSVQIAALSRDFDGIVEANALVATDDEHDPEGSSTAFERAHVAALLAQARDHLTDLDRALERLEEGDYGRCEGCGEPIPTQRLEVRPAARTCIRCAAG